MTLKNKLFTTSATVALVASAIVPVASAAEFQDADKIQDWAKDAINALVNDEVLQGDDKGFLNPTGVITRATAAEILYKAKTLSTEGTEEFPDVNEDDWFYKAVVATSQAGIFEGNEKGQFNPNDKLTREQAATVIVRAFELTGEADLSEFDDADNVSDWAKEAVAIAVNNGVIKGDGTSLNPGDGISRQEMAVMVHRVLEKQAETPAPTPTESAPVVESVTLNSADEIVIAFEEAIGTEVDTNKITVAGFEGTEAKELTGEDFTANVVDNELTLTAKEGVKFATASEGNGGEGNLISFAEGAVVSVSVESAALMAAMDVAEGTVEEGKLAGVNFVDNAAPVLLSAKEVSNTDVTLTFSEDIVIEGEVAPLFSTSEILGETAVAAENTLVVTFADAWKDSETVLEEVTIKFASNEEIYIADAAGNVIETAEVTGVQELEVSVVETPEAPVEGETTETPEAPVEGETPATPEATVEEETPATPEAPVEGETPVTTETPVGEESNGSTEAPVAAEESTEPTEAPSLEGSTNVETAPEEAVAEEPTNQETEEVAAEQTV